MLAVSTGLGFSDESKVEFPSTRQAHDKKKITYFSESLRALTSSLSLFDYIEVPNRQLLTIIKY